MNLFIDTNVFLSFFHFSSNDLEELKKLGILVSKGSITLFLPEQVKSEFRRNRDSKIADAVKRLRDQKLSLQFPQLFKEYGEYEPLRTALRESDRLKSILLEKVETDIRGSLLKADVVIANLFGKAKLIADSEAQLMRARARMLRGNPPGKKGSHGDALNWEALLDSVPKGEDLLFVSEDGDWSSPLDDDDFDSFLTEEWRTAKGSKIVFYRHLATFLAENFKEINLAAEEEKEDLIRQLATAGSFSAARAKLQRLAWNPDFTASQLNEIARAAVTNNQVYWIINDKDMTRYIRSLLGPHLNVLDPELVKQLESLLGGPLAE